MPVRFYLQPNPVTSNPHDQYARVSVNQTFTQDDIVKQAILRGTTLTETDLRAAMNLVFTVVADAVANGNAVLLPLVNIRPSISGNFKDISDSFDSKRHSKGAAVSTGMLLNRKMQEAAMEKIGRRQPMPALLAFKDVSSGSINQLITGGGIAQLAGSGLKFDQANGDEGVFLLHTLSQTLTKITILATLTDTRLIFKIPENLATGLYLLQVRRAYCNNRQIRIGVLDARLELTLST